MAPTSAEDPTSTVPTHAERLAAAARLLSSISETPRLDAEILLASALGTSRSSLLARMKQRALAPDFDAMIERRAAAEPIAYILGEWEFFSLRIKVRPPLLVPRPETEHLVETVLSYIGKASARVLELGTGTGCVSVAIAYNSPNSRLIATDLSTTALDTAAENSRKHGVADRITLRQGDLFDAIQDDSGPFDVICSNPPYVEEAAWNDLAPVIRMYEDRRALLAGVDGLDVIRRLVHDAPTFLKPTGLLAFEIGMDQWNKTRQLLADRGYRDIRFCPDLSGIERIAIAQWK